MRPSALKKDIYSVSRLNSEIRAVLEGSFPLLWIEGEISNLSTPRSGHSYFSLKDVHAQVRCALFRGKKQLLRFQPKDGDKILARARISLYEARGDFQLIIEHMEPAGEGDLQLAFEQLKRKLDEEGLFDSSKKLPLPRFPQRVGIITSPTGAAIRDILHILKRRFPALPVVIYPALVQGDQAAEELSQALKMAEQRQECDLLILTRGGGSLEDLAAFNDEQLTRTIASLTIPVISAVGHEVDFSIADFVADRRAPTPSAAAEIATPEIEHIDEKLNQNISRLMRALQNKLRNTQGLLNNLGHKIRLLHPIGQVQQQQQKVDELDFRLSTSIQQKLTTQQITTRNLATHLISLSPQKQIPVFKNQTRQLYQRLQHHLHTYLKQQHIQISSLARELNAISPLETLGRGYSITLTEDGNVLRSGKDVKSGDKIQTRLALGQLVSVVEVVES